MAELTSTYPFYVGVDLEMPQRGTIRLSSMQRQQTAISLGICLSCKQDREQPGHKEGYGPGRRIERHPSQRPPEHVTSISG